MNNRRINEIILNIFGWFLILVSFLAYYNALIDFKTPSRLLWFSYFAFLIIGIGILTKKTYIIGSQLNIVFIPYILWNIDFFYRLFTSMSLFGITDYFFEPGTTFISRIVTIQHAFIIPIALYAIYIYKFKRKGFWKLSLIQVFAIFILTRILSNPVDNVNCAFTNCIPISIDIGIYPFVWLFVYLLMIFITHFILTRFRIFVRG